MGIVERLAHCLEDVGRWVLAGGGKVEDGPPAGIEAFAALREGREDEVRPPAQGLFPFLLR